MERINADWLSFVIIQPWDQQAQTWHKHLPIEGRILAPICLKEAEGDHLSGDVAQPVMHYEAKAGHILLQPWTLSSAYYQARCP